MIAATAETNGKAKTSSNSRPKAPKVEAAIPLYEMDIRTIKVHIVGLGPLLSHKFSEKQKQAIENKQQKKAKTAKEARDPDQDFKDALYVLPGPVFGEEGCRLGIPAIAFKKAIVCAARFTDAKMTELRGLIFVRDTAGGLVEIKYEELVCRESTVRVGMGTLDLRYRPEFRGWSAELLIQYNASVVSAEQVVNLINTAGFSIGVGDYRVECNGDCGQFRVAVERMR